MGRLVLFLTLLVNLGVRWCRGHGQNCWTVADVRNSNGTVTKEDCIFPFTYKNKTFHRCTDYMEPSGKLWCSVEVDREGVHVEGRRGHCRSDCVPLETTRPKSKRSIECVAKRDGQNGRCVFPFIFRGKTYQTCTADHDPGKKVWCSTSVNAKGQHEGAKWGYCNCASNNKCPAADENTLSRALTDGTYLPSPSDRTFACGLQRLLKPTSAQVIGGTPTDLQEFPFAVLLVYYDSSGIKKYNCAGSLINRRYVLTAAHCMDRQEPSQVLLGDYDISQRCDCLESLCAPLPQEISVEEIRLHEGYNGNGDRSEGELISNDIALIRLAKPAELNPGVGVVCLPMTPSVTPGLEGEQVTVVGWGKTNWNSNGAYNTVGVASSKIQKVSLPIISLEKCARDWSAVGKVTSDHICAGKKNSDSCKGDSGGPMIYRNPTGRAAIDPEPWILRGVVSFGAAKCGDGTSAIYTRVENYINWIKQNIQI